MAGLIPLSDATRRPAHFPIATISIIAINAFAFYLELSKGDDFVLQWAAVPANITAGHGWLTLFTAMFMHGGWLHIIGNMVFLWAFAPEIEDVMNPLRFTAFYVAGGLVSMLAQIVASPTANVPCLGASGAIAAVMGAFIVIYPRDRIRSLLIIFIFVRVAFIPAAALIGIWFVLQLFHLGAVANVQTGGVAYMAHVVGFIFGTLTARFLVSRQRVMQAA